MANGVMITAIAKLNRSAHCFVAPVSIPTEMVEPERENPRKGRQSPCSRPIQPACRIVTLSVGRRVRLAAAGSFADVPSDRFSRRPAIRIRIPAQASAGATRRPCVHNGCGMNWHRDGSGLCARPSGSAGFSSLSASLHMTSASATTTPSTVARPPFWPRSPCV